MIGNSVVLAAEFLQAGHLVGFPTETVYGLAGNALLESSVTQIFRVKNRPQFDPLIVHTHSLESAKEYVEALPTWAMSLARHFWAGSLTLLLPKKKIIPDLVTSGSNLVALRVPAHPIALELLRLLPFPLAAPSANPFGYISPTTAQHVADQLGREIPYILDGGACSVGVESTIVGESDGKITVFRKGGISLEAIEAVVGKVAVTLHSSSNPQAPGMLKSHYAPSVPLVLGQIPELLQTFATKRLGVLSFAQTYPQIAPENQMVLSAKADLNEAAQNLFGAMRKLDQRPLDLIVAELLPEQGLGRAINDRLRRAAAR